jgi:hypothetical protein
MSRNHGGSRMPAGPKKWLLIGVAAVLLFLIVLIASMALNRSFRSWIPAIPPAPEVLKAFALRVEDGPGGRACLIVNATGRTLTDVKVALSGDTDGVPNPKLYRRFTRWPAGEEKAIEVPRPMADRRRARLALDGTALASGAADGGRRVRIRGRWAH